MTEEKQLIEAAKAIIEKDKEEQWIEHAINIAANDKIKW